MSFLKDFSAVGMATHGVLREIRFHRHLWHAKILFKNIKTIILWFNFLWNHFTGLEKLLIVLKNFHNESCFAGSQAKPPIVTFRKHRFESIKFEQRNCSPKSGPRCSSKRVPKYLEWRTHEAQKVSFERDFANHRHRRALPRVVQHKLKSTRAIGNKWLISHDQFAL